MILEVERLTFKTFNTMIAEQLKQEANLIKSFLRMESEAKKSGNINEAENSFPATEDQRMM